MTAGLAAPAVDLSQIWRPSFPSPGLVSAAVALFPELPAQDCTTSARRDPRSLRHYNPVRLVDRRRLYLSVGPGVLALRSFDPVRAERAAERVSSQARHYRDQMGLCLAEGREVPRAVRRMIAAWSPKSQARMFRTLAELDWAPLAEPGRLPCMTTLTYPGDWRAACPDAMTQDAHLRAFYRRYLRAWGEPWRGAWKREYQRRGAPHWHGMHPMPTGLAGAHRPGSRPAVGDGLPYRLWLSLVWADIVAAPDPEERRRHAAAGTGVDLAEGLRCADPRRLACYFAKHGRFAAKDYQNRPPREWAGQPVGRYWGYRGLRRCAAEVELAPRMADQAARVLRRWSRAQGRYRDVRAPRARGGAVVADAPVIGLAGVELVTAHRTRRRKVRRRAVYMARGPGGFVCVNDGPVMAGWLARSLGVVPGPARELP